MMLDLYLPGVFFATLLGIIALSVPPLIVLWPITSFLRYFNRVIKSRS